jgi:hypothetical protein
MKKIFVVTLILLLSHSFFSQSYDWRDVQKEITHHEDSVTVDCPIINLTQNVHFNIHSSKKC